MCSRTLAAITALAICASLTSHCDAAGLRISPELDPKSDKTFFAKDYPDDHRTVTGHHFEHPFPHVQDSGDYDKDYVKDENADGGEWSAQMEYDQLRHQIDKQKSAIAKAKDAMDGHDKDLNAAEDAEKVAEERANAAEEKMKEAKAKEEAAKQAEDEASKNVADANKTEGSANMTLDDCKKQLADAKGKVEKLKGEAAAAKEAAEGAKKAAGENASRAKQSEALDIEALEKTHKDAAAAAAAAEEEAAALKKALDELRQKAELEEKEHKEAEKSHDQIQGEIKDTEKDLTKATETLRKVRLGQADPGGGIHREKSGAPHQLSLAFAAAIVAACFF